MEKKKTQIIFSYDKSFIECQSVVTAVTNSSVIFLQKIEDFLKLFQLTISFKKKSFFDRSKFKNWSISRLHGVWYVRNLAFETITLVFLFRQ